MERRSQYNLINEKGFIQIAAFEKLKDDMYPNKCPICGYKAPVIRIYGYTYEWACQECAQQRDEWPNDDDDDEV